MDYYSALREFTEEHIEKEGKLFKPRPAKWFVPRSNVGNTGADYYFAKNPEFGAVFTYHLANEFSTQKSSRQKRENELNKAQKSIPFPGWEALDRESLESEAQVLLTIEDQAGNIINKVKQKAEKGSHRITWNLEHFNPFAISLDGNSRNGGAALVTPGTYKATLYLEKEGQLTTLDGPLSFEVKPIRSGVLKGVSYQDYNAFRMELTHFVKEVNAMQDRFTLSKKMHAAFETALAR